MTDPPDWLGDDTDPIIEAQPLAPPDPPGPIWLWWLAAIVALAGLAVITIRG
jgi:hypothetical protein